MPGTAVERLTAAIQTAVEAPGDRAACWHLAEMVAADWSASPIGHGDGYSDADLDVVAATLGHPFPAALREAYKLFGQRDDLTRNQDPFASLAELEIREDALVFRTENQGVCWWGVLLSDVDKDDPPTVLGADLADESGKKWTPWTDRLSTALVDMLMMEAVLSEEDEDMLEFWQPGDESTLVSGLRPLPSLMPESCQSSWFIGDDVLVHVLGGGWTTVRARTPEAMAAFNGDDGDDDDEYSPLY